MTRRLGNVGRRGRAGTRCRGARGTSMVELSATLVILGLVMGVLYTGIASLSNTYTQSARRTTNLNEARVLMADASKDFRTAVKPPNANSVFILAGPQFAWFYGYLDPVSADVAASWVLMSVDTQGQLVEYTWPADPPNPATAGIDWTYTYSPPQYAWHTRFVGRYIANPASMPVLTYLDASGNVLAPETTGWLSTTKAAQVAAVKITLVVRKTQARASDNATGDATLINRVRLPNIDQLKVPPT